MFVVTVGLTIDPSKGPDFMALMRANAEASRREEPGCQRFDICYNDRAPWQVFLYEIYDDAAAFDAHLASKHFRAFDAATADMILSKEVNTYDEVVT